MLWGRDILSAASVLAMLAVSGCVNQTPTLMHERRLVYKGNSGSAELLTVRLVEKVPDGAFRNDARMVKDFGIDGSLAAADWLQTRNAYRIGFNADWFQRDGQPAQIQRKQKALGPPAFAIEAVSLAPDGKWVVFACQEYHDESWMVWIMRPDGTEPTALHSGRSPTWRDSQTVVFADGGDLWQMNLDHSRLQRLVTADPGEECLQPQVSPDGRWLAYVKAKIGQYQSRDIWRLDLQTNTQLQWTINPSRDDLPQWTADNRALLFRSTRQARWRVWKLPLSTTKTN